MQGIARGDSADANLVAPEGQTGAMGRLRKLLMHLSKEAENRSEGAKEMTRPAWLRLAQRPSSSAAVERSGMSVRYSALLACALVLPPHHCHLNVGLPRATDFK